MKKITAMVLAICMFVAFTNIGGLTVGAAYEPIAFVALGDSISTGYGLNGYAPPTATTPAYASESYVELLKANEDFSTTNFAVDGLTSAQLAAATNPAIMGNMQKAILQNADVISITIGGNDLIGAFYAAMGVQLGITIIDSSTLPIIQVAIVAGANGDPTYAPKLMAAMMSVAGNLNTIAAAYANQLTTIITNLKEINPSAMLMLQTIANPYKSIPNATLVAALDAGVNALNTVIVSGAGLGGYKVADVYTAFKNSSEVLTNATNPATPLDPHPNTAGHKIIADIVFEQWEAQFLKPQITAPLDFTSMDTTDKLETEGWKWDNSTKMLTLAGFNMNVNLDGGWNQPRLFAIKLPENATIVATEGTVNRVNIGGVDSDGYKGGQYFSGIYSVSSDTTGTKPQTGITITGTGEFSINANGGFCDAIRSDYGFVKILGMNDFHMDAAAGGTGSKGIIASGQVLIEDSILTDFKTGDVSFTGTPVNFINSTAVISPVSNSPVESTKDSLVKDSTLTLTGTNYGWMQWWGMLTIDNSNVTATTKSDTAYAIYNWLDRNASAGYGNGVTITNNSKVSVHGGKNGIVVNFGETIVDNSELIATDSTFESAIISGKAIFKGDSKVALSGAESSVKKALNNEKCEIVVEDGTTDFTNGYKLISDQEFTINAGAKAMIPQGKVFTNDGTMKNNGILALNNATCFTGNGNITCNSDSDLSKSGHQYLLKKAGSSTNVPPTCTTDGIDYYLCDLCDTEISVTTPVGGHSFGEWVTDDAINHKHACTCGEVEKQAHTWNAGEITTPPTNTQEGVKTFTCTVCTQTKTEVVEKLANKRDLIALIDYSKLQMEAPEYKYVVPVVKAALTDRLAKAEALRDDVYAEQKDVDNAYNALLKIVHMLKYVGDNTTLVQLYDLWVGFDETIYIKETVDIFKLELAKAKAVIDDTNALQAEIDKARDELLKAIWELRLIPNKDELNALIEEYKNMDYTQFTKESMEPVHKTYAILKAVLENPNSTEDEKYIAEDNFISAMSGRVLISGSGSTPDTPRDEAETPVKPVEDTGTTDETMDETPTTVPTTSDNAPIAVAFAMALIGCVVLVIKRKQQD